MAEHGGAGVGISAGASGEQEATGLRVRGR
jgi:hypothetical protein